MEFLHVNQEKLLWTTKKKKKTTRVHCHSALISVSPLVEITRNKSHIDDQGTHTLILIMPFRGTTQKRDGGV